MARNITDITTSQTFQNWFDKTNELAQFARVNAVTASSVGDTTSGDATLEGNFEAEILKANDELWSDHIRSYNSTNNVIFDSATEFRGTSSRVVSTFAYTAGGPRLNLTDDTTTWEMGMDNSTDTNFIIDTGSGSTKLTLSPAGNLTVNDINVRSDITVVDLTTTDRLNANTATINNIVLGTGGKLVGNLTGDVTGDIYHPSATGGNGTGKVLENGGPAANIPATFWGNVVGTVSSLSNQTTNTLAEGTDNRVGESAPGERDGGNNLYFTKARAQGSFSWGTGISESAADSNGVRTISIGQDVAVRSAVQFREITINNGQTGSNADDTILINGAAGTITAEGDITAFGSVSDITMKENINPIESALDKVMQLGGYTFNYKNKPETPMTGVMAQEVEKVLPECVYKTIDGKTGEEIYAVRHGNLIGLLIEAIKELSAKVEK